MEKPFLEHLEDLRATIMRIALTLVIAMTVAFTFQDKLMHVLRRPVDQVWVLHQAKLLPKGLDADSWEKVKHIERAAAGLDEASRESFYRHLGDDSLRFHAKSVALLRAVLQVPEANRENFISSLDADAALKAQVRLLLLTKPSPDIDGRGNLQMMSALRPTETFMLSMKLALFAGIVLAFPVLVFFILQFVVPGLHLHERRMLWPALMIGFGLFLFGVCFAYFLVLPRALEFFYDWSTSLGVSNDWRIGDYISFATQFTLLFGVAFELPVVVMLLVKLGLIGYEGMHRTRSYAIVAIFLAAAIITPDPSVVTMSLMAVPMVFLYECCIWLAWWDARKQRKAEEAERAARTYPPYPPSQPQIPDHGPHLPDEPSESDHTSAPAETPHESWENPYDLDDGDHPENKE